MNVNAFDQPDVQDSKTRTAAKINEYADKGKLEELKAVWEDENIEICTTEEEDLSEYAATREFDDDDYTDITSANFSIEYVSTNYDGSVTYIINADVTDAQGRTYKIENMQVELVVWEGTFNEETGVYDWTPYEGLDEEGSLTGIEEVENATNLNLNAPMFNVLGQKVDAQFRGVVIQNGKKYILR